MPYTTSTMKSSFCSVYNLEKYRLTSILIEQYLPDGHFDRILIKPNWVMHQQRSSFPISAIVTNTKLIEMTINACLIKYPGANEITIADAPLQSCDWDELRGQTGINELIDKYRDSEKPRISFCDLRRERYRFKGGYIERDLSWSDGDPSGYREVVLDHLSFLEPISQASRDFRVSDYDPFDTISNHRHGYHRYLISGTVLDADLIINMPKIKTHQKAGITGALKNVVGINGNKAFLVHHRKGKEGTGGDEFPSDVSPIILLQTRLREILQKKSPVAFYIGRAVWKIVKAALNIKTEGLPENMNKRFYTASGSWYGNDTVWRMIYDLNKIVLYAPKEGMRLNGSRQREYISIMDGIVAGEGNGPIQPLPVNLNLVGFSNNPFLMDMVMTRFMGFDYTKIPQLKNHCLFNDAIWTKFDPTDVVVEFNGQIYQGIHRLPILHKFLPPPGWKGHIEL